MNNLAMSNKNLLDYKLAEELYLKIRQILTGRKYGPSMNELLALFNREETLRRIKSNCES